MLYVVARRSCPQILAADTLKGFSVHRRVFCGSGSQEREQLQSDVKHTSTRQQPQPAQRQPSPLSTDPREEVSAKVAEWEAFHPRSRIWPDFVLVAVIPRRDHLEGKT